MMCEIRYHTYRTADRNKDIGIKAPANYNMESCRIAKSLDTNIMQKKICFIGKKNRFVTQIQCKYDILPLIQITAASITGFY